MIPNIELFTIPMTATVRQAMECIDRNAGGIALVLDNEGKLLGTVTDGDLRRALLRGTGMNTQVLPHIRTQFTTVEPETSREEVLDQMQARRLDQIPVLDGDGRLVGLHLLHELLGMEDRPNWAVIMCGGRGMRLRPITENMPKPMVKVAGRPILERLVLHLVGYGFRRIFLAVNHLSHIIEEYFGDGRRFGCGIEYIRETEPMHTGGALALLPETPVAPVVVMNGDLVTQVDLGRMMGFHGSGGYEGTIGFRRYVQEIPFGCLDVEGEALVSIEEKPMFERLINAGVYVLSPRLVAKVPARNYLITELFEAALQEGLPIGAFEIEDEWVDVGYKEQLRKAREGI